MACTHDPVAKWTIWMGGTVQRMHEANLRCNRMHYKDPE